MKIIFLMVVAALGLSAAVPPYASESFVPEVRGEKTGFFHTMKAADGKWWVIDPLGRGFGVFGIDYVIMEGFSSWQTESKAQLKNNLRRYGSRAAWEEATLRRLNDWGFNMLGAGSDENLRHRGLVHAERMRIGASFCDYDRESFIDVFEHRPCSGFPNVFHPDFPAYCDRECAKTCAPQKDDPWLLGYFTDNELRWWGQGNAQDEHKFDYGLYLCASRLPKEHSARRALDAYLREQGVAEGVEPSMDVKRGFVRLCAERYFAIVTSAIRKADPNHMILGARFAIPGGPHIWREAGKYCDIIAMNCYATADFDANVIRYQGSTLEKVYREFQGYAGKPMIITEWSFPALDSGLPCTFGAGQRFRTQTGRTRATKLFAQTLLSLPFIVGYDYFMWTDEPALGIASHFPENTNYGLTNNDGEAYPEITAMFTDLQKNVWRERNRPTPAERKVAKRPPIDAATMQRALGLDPAPADGTPVACREDGDVRTVSNAAGLSLVFAKQGTPRILLDGAFCGTLAFSCGARYQGAWHGRDNAEIADFRFRNDGVQGVADVALRGEDGSLLKVRFTVAPGRLPFLVELTGLENGVRDVAPTQHFWCDVVSPFHDYSVPDSVQQLWRSPPYQSWFAADGKRLGVVSLSPHLDNLRFSVNERGGYGGNLEWELPEVLTVPKGKPAALDGCYALVVPGYGGRKAWREFVAPLKPSVDESGLDASPAGEGWPLLTMRQMTVTSQDAPTVKELIAIHAKYPGACGEFWLAEGYPPAVEDQTVRAQALGDLAPRLRAAGIRVGFQQGVTLCHDFSTKDKPDFRPAFANDECYQVDVDGKKTVFFCPTSPEVLAHEERYAETYVRLGKAESFWLDDDLRLGFGKARAAGCWCERCLKLLNKKAGANLTRKEWIARLDADVADEPLRAVWSQFKQESLAGFAAAARRGAKRANPDVRMGYQSISSASICDCGADYRPVLAALSDGFRDTVGIRPGHGFYKEVQGSGAMIEKLLDVAREAERCRAIPGWHGSVAYEQENWPHYVREKSAEMCVKEGAMALAAGCDAVAQYWYSSKIPEPLEHYEDLVRLTQAWRPYLKRLADLSYRTHLGGVAHRIDPQLMTSRANSVSNSLAFAMPRRRAKDVALAEMGVPVTVEESGTKNFYDEKDVPGWMFTSAERDRFLDCLDRETPVCVRVDKVHPLVVFPRVDAKGRTVAVTFLNISPGAALRLPVRLRRPAGGKATVLRPCAEDAPLEVRPGEGDELRVTLPDLPSWSMLTLVLQD